MKTKKVQKKTWEEEFDKMFFQNTDSEKVECWLAMDTTGIIKGRRTSKIANPRDVKSFISKQITLARNKTLDKAIKEINWCEEYSLHEMSIKKEMVDKLNSLTK